MKFIAYASIDFAGSPKVREKLHDQTLADYTECYREKRDLPPPVVFQDEQSLLLADGLHRFESARAAGRDGLTCEVYQGNYSDCLRFALTANVGHGLPRSPGDKRACILAALKEWPKKTQREIAQLCDVSPQYVSQVETSTCPDVITKKYPPRKRRTHEQLQRILESKAKLDMKEQTSGTTTATPLPPPAGSVSFSGIRVDVMHKIHELSKLADRMIHAHAELALMAEFRRLACELHKVDETLHGELPGMENALPQQPKGKATLEQVIAFVSGKLGFPNNDAQWFFEKNEGCGWKVDGKPIQNWEMVARAWSRIGIFPSQKVIKGVKGGPPIRSPNEAAIERIMRIQV